MSDEFYYVLKNVEDWTERELRHAEQNPTVINKNLHSTIRYRLDAIESNQRMISMASKHQTEKRELKKKLLVSFMDLSSKPAGSLDVRSVKHAVTDATKDKKGLCGISFAGVIAAYEWANNHPELTKHLPDIPVILWAALILMGLAVWAVKLAENLHRKLNQDHR